MVWIESVIERHAHSRVEYMIKAKSQFKRRSTANNVEVIIPVPMDADSPKFKTTIGSVKYAPEQNAIIWMIKSFPVSGCQLFFSSLVFCYSVRLLTLNQEPEKNLSKSFFHNRFILRFFCTNVGFFFV